jgi:hypothetical protein
MRHQQREDVRTEKMMISTKRAIEATVVNDEVEKLPGPSRERLGEIRALVGVSDLTRLAAIKLIQELKQECLERRINWEQVCEESLPKCRRSIDRYLDTLETFGDGMYEAILDVTTRAERVQARRLLKTGELWLDGDCIVIADRRVRNVPEEAHTIIEIIRESMAREKAAKEEAAREKALRKADHERAEREKQAILDGAEATRQELERWKGQPAPAGLKSDAERRVFARLLTWQIDNDAKANGILDLLKEQDYGGVFWFELATWLSRQRKVLDELLKACLTRHGDSFAETGLRAPMVHLEIPTGQWEQRGGAELAAAIAAPPHDNGHGRD